MESNVVDRKEYWNKEYTKYWKEATEEANADGTVSRMVKTTSGDYKTPGEKVMIDFFNSIPYIRSDKLLDYGCGFEFVYLYF